MSSYCPVGTARGSDTKCPTWSTNATIDASSINDCQCVAGAGASITNDPITCVRKLVIGGTTATTRVRLTMCAAMWHE
jgi:hypothetical protein